MVKNMCLFSNDLVKTILFCYSVDCAVPVVQPVQVAKGCFGTGGLNSF